MIVDCRSKLGDMDYGRTQYQQSHIPNAIFAHLEYDLSGPIIQGTTGRHPLPAPIDFIAKLNQWGIDYQTQVIAYDDAGGAYAARLWWMMRWLGHHSVAVLNGGWQAWKNANAKESTAQTKAHLKAPFIGEWKSSMVVTTAEVLAHHNSSTFTLMDARAANRYAGNDETIDPIAGHIPGALNFPFMDNLSGDGHFKTPALLRERFEALSTTAANNAKPLVSYCGSGVTACHNILAMAHAGLNEPKLYAGSWSEWITHPEHKVGVGENP